MIDYMIEVLSEAWWEDVTMVGQEEESAIDWIGWHNDQIEDQRSEPS